MPLKNGQINQGGLGRHTQRQAILDARAAGVAFVNVGPLRSDLLEGAEAEWLALRPSTDAAVLLGIAHTLYEEGLYDRTFVERYTSGFDRFLPYLTGAEDGTPKSADWAAAISGLPAESLRSLARRMAATRTMLSVSWSLTRQDHGEQTFWAAITVAAMLGQIGLPGGGIGFGYSALNSIGQHYAKVPGAAVPQGENPVEDFIPVARISDMLLSPGASFDYDGGTYRYPDNPPGLLGRRQSLPSSPGSKPHAAGLAPAGDRDRPRVVLERARQARRYRLALHHPVGAQRPRDLAP